MAWVTLACSSAITTRFCASRRRIGASVPLTSPAATRLQYNSSKLGEALRRALATVAPSRMCSRRMADTWRRAGASCRSFITRNAWSICRPPSSKSASSSVNRMIWERLSLTGAFGRSAAAAAPTLLGLASSVTRTGVRAWASSLRKASAREPTARLPVIVWPAGSRAV